MKKNKRSIKQTFQSDDEETNHRITRFQYSHTNENVTDRKEGQTMFNFFKRCKKHTLQQEIHKQLKSYNPKRQSGQLNHQKKVQPQTQRIVFIQTPQRRTRLNKHNDLSDTKFSNIQRLYDEGLATSRPSISPIRKVKFAQSREPSANTRRSGSILEALSPFKKLNQENCNRFYLSANDDKGSTRSLRQKGKVIMPKDNLLNKMAILKDKLQNFAQSGKLFRNKTHTVTITALKLLNSVCEQCKNNESLNKQPSIQFRKTSQLKTSIKSVDKLYKEFEAQNPSQTTDDLYTLLKEKLSLLENRAFEHYDRTIHTTKEEITEKYDNKINELEKQNQKLLQEIENCQMKLAKHQNKYSQYMSQQTQKQEQNKRQIKERTEEWRQKLNETEDKHKIVKEELQKAIEDVKTLERQQKTLECEKKSLIKSFEQQRIQIQSMKQQLFMDDMARSKLQYQQHLNQMSKVYQLKEASLIEDLKRYEIALKNHDVKYQKNKQLTDEQIKITKTQVQQLRAQNRSIGVILKNLEEQSFMLWSALKDIKILSSRLGLFNKFSRIYDDISFSDVAYR